MKYTVKSVLCLDLDWTVRNPISDCTFIKDAKDIMLMPNVEKKIWEYKNKGYYILGITNQGGVAMGYKTTSEIHNEILATYDLFDDDPFDRIMVCFDMENGKIEPFNMRSLNRKPEVGMLAMAEHYVALEEDITLDWDNSLIVGDLPSDMKLALNAKVPFEWAKDFFSWDSIENS